MYGIDQKARGLRQDFVPGQNAPADGKGGFLQRVFVDTTVDSVSVIVTVSFWKGLGGS